MPTLLDRTRAFAVRGGKSLRNMSISGSNEEILTAVLIVFANHNRIISQFVAPAGKDSLTLAREIHQAAVLASARCRSHGPLVC